MFSHILVGANDVEASKKFYDSAFGALGIGPGNYDDKGRVFYMTSTGVFGIGNPIDGQAATHANGGTIGFLASSPEAAKAWHDQGVANGGTSCEDPPGLRESPMGSMYLAYM